MVVNIRNVNVFFLPAPFATDLDYPLGTPQFAYLSCSVLFNISCQGAMESSPKKVFG